MAKTLPAANRKYGQAEFPQPQGAHDDLDLEDLSAGGPSSHLLIKNLMFWGSVLLTCAGLYFVASFLF